MALECDRCIRQLFIVQFLNPSTGFVSTLNVVGEVFSLLNANAPPIVANMAIADKVYFTFFISLFFFQKLTLVR